MNILTTEFYQKPAPEVAPLLLGKYLCRQHNNYITKLQITETEAYYSEADTACHASKGKTDRTKIMWQQGGVAYIYLCYGMHFMLNIVTGNNNMPEAVLIRGVKGLNGPGKLTKALNINKTLNGINLSDSTDLWIEDPMIVSNYLATPRVGINYATEEYRNKLWRFVAIP